MRGRRRRRPDLCVVVVVVVAVEGRRRGRWSRRCWGSVDRHESSAAAAAHLVIDTAARPSSRLGRRAAWHCTYSRPDGPDSVAAQRRSFLYVSTGPHSRTLKSNGTASDRILRVLRLFSQFSTEIRPNVPRRHTDHRLHSGPYFTPINSHTATFFSFISYTKNVSGYTRMRLLRREESN